MSRVDAPPAGSLESLNIRAFRLGDEPAILDCMRECFGEAPDLAAWRHLHFANPAGPPIVWLAWSGQTVVGHVALLPRRIRAFGQEGLAGHSVYAMTRPAWQRRGVSRTLAAEAWRAARARGLLAVYGFANEQSLAGILGYQGRQAVGPLPVMVRPLRPVGAAARLAYHRLRARPGAGPSGTPVGGLERPPPGWTRSAFDHRHTALFRGTGSPAPVAVVRDAAYLAWRYRSTPDTPYLQRDVASGKKLAATVVLRLARRFGLDLAFVMEWSGPPEWHGPTIDALRHAIALGRDAGVHGVAALARRGSPERRMLRRLGFLGVPETLLPGTVCLTVRPAPELELDGRWHAPAGWYLTWGDGLLL